MLLNKLKLTKQECYLFLCLWSLCVLSSFLGMPYTFSLLKGSNIISNITYSSLALTHLLNGVLILPIPIYFGFLIRRHISVAEIINWKAISRQDIILGIVIGLVVGCLLQMLDIVFSNFIPALKNLMDKPQPRLAYGFLASFYGGIYEETLTRFFLTSLLLLLFKKLKVVGAWMAIVLAAVIFAVGHLPTLAQFIGLSDITNLPGLLVVRTIILNSLAGIVFGWLYWKKGLWLAILSHFMADIIIHVVFPLF